MDLSGETMDHSLRLRGHRATTGWTIELYI